MNEDSEDTYNRIDKNTIIENNDHVEDPSNRVNEMKVNDV